MDESPARPAGDPPLGTLLEGKAAPARSRFGRMPDGLAFGWLEPEAGVRLRYAIARVAEGPCRGTILLLPGRTEYIEKYFETVADLLERRFEVIVLDWRGQGLSARLLPHARRGYVEAYEDYLSDLRRFVAEVVEPEARAPVTLIAHSMGAHLALRFLHERPDAVARAVLCAPLVDIRARLLPRPLMRLAVRAALRLGLHGAYVLGHSDRGALYRGFEGNRLTGCPDRFQAMRALMESTEGVGLGGITYQWLKATLESIAVVASPDFVEAITTPVLICSAGLDRVVSNAAQARLAARLPRGRLRVFEGARHEILMETDAVRAAFFEQLEAFVAET